MVWSYDAVHLSSLVNTPGVGADLRAQRKREDQTTNKTKTAKISKCLFLSQQKGGEGESSE